MKKGKLFVIDGTDGSGKQTQLEKLRKRLDEENEGGILIDQKKGVNETDGK